MIQNADLYHMQLWFLILDNHYSIEMVTNPRKRFARQPLDGPGSQYFSKTVMGDREISTFQMKWVTYTCRYFKGKAGICFSAEEIPAIPSNPFPRPQYPSTSPCF